MKVPARVRCNGLALAGLIYDPESLGVPKIRTLFEAT